MRMKPPTDIPVAAQEQKRSCPVCNSSAKVYGNAEADFRFCLHNGKDKASNASCPNSGELVKKIQVPTIRRK